MKGTKTKLKIAMSFIRMLSEGPDVSLNGSPTVSPTTAALCASEPLPPCAPVSMYCFALSQAPPELEDDRAMTTPQTSEPARRPASAGTPKRTPYTIGVPITRMPGAIILRRAAEVEIATQDL